MSIKQAMGWLALLLFTTTAHAEGARDPFRREAKEARAIANTPVTPKTKAAPPVVSESKAALPQTH
jgi:hypothetical protein